MKFARKRTLEAGKLDIAPLVDVVFLLLIFFMLTSSFINPTGISINVPRSSAVEPQEKRNPVVSISKDEKVYWEDRPIAWKDLRERMASGRKARPGGGLIIKADRETRHGRVVDVMTLARETGWKRLAVAARPGISRPPDGPPAP